MHASLIPGLVDFFNVGFEPIPEVIKSCCERARHENRYKRSIYSDARRQG
jgi:hypothetical protein